MNKRIFWFCTIVSMSFFLSGCLLFDIPMQIINMVAGVVGTVVDIVSKLPKPPPGVF